MADDTRSELRRALDDLIEGIRALLLLGPARPELVCELLGAGGEDPREHPDDSVREPRGDDLRSPHGLFDPDYA
jgi:hypothetical protein